MKKELKELIESASPYKDELLDGFLIIDSGELYNGNHGNNGYNNLIIVGYRNNPTKYYLITTISDVFDVYKIESCHLDIDHDLGCISIWFFKPIIAKRFFSDYLFEGIEIEEGRKDKENKVD